jgi:hypothetical protein
MALKDLKPAPGEGGRVAGGFVLSFFLHVPAMIAVGVIGSWIDPKEGYLLIVPFLAGIGIAEWIYLWPSAWLLRRRGRAAIAKGVLIGGGLVTLGSTVCYGGMGLMSLQNLAEVRRIQQDERDHPTDFISTDGVITLVDDKHFEFKRDDTGEIVSLQTWKEEEFILLKANGGYEKQTRDLLKAGARVAIDYSQERGKPPISASIVRVYEEGRRN